MVDKPQVRKGTGPDQLPQGAATDINSAPQGTPPQDPQIAAAQPAFAEAQPLPPPDNFTPRTEDENILFGPGSGLGVSIIAANPNPPPRNVQDWMPTLMEASRHPDAPEQLRTLVTLLLHSMKN
jgi:hypothetical protein